MSSTANHNYKIGEWQITGEPVWSKTSWYKRAWFKIKTLIIEKIQNEWQKELKEARQKAKTKFFNDLDVRLEKLFPKGERCECGRKLPCRSKALAFNAFVHIFSDDILENLSTDEKL